MIFAAVGNFRNPPEWPVDGAKVERSPLFTVTAIAREASSTKGRFWGDY